MRFLIEKERSPRDMLCLGGHYYEKRQFDLALKYYEMAASFDYDPAYECLGYIWYYGRTGERDYKKAILVLNSDLKKLGYVPEKDNVVFARLMDAGKILKAKVVNVEKIGTFTQISIGIYLVDL